MARWFGDGYGSGRQAHSRSYGREARGQRRPKTPASARVGATRRLLDNLGSTETVHAAVRLTGTRTRMDNPGSTAHFREQQVATYLIGDVQGCADAFDALLLTLRFDPAHDRLIVLGDLVNRGPQSLRSIERLMELGDSAQCLLGNHDLHLLAVAHGIRKAHRSDTLDDILASPRRDALIDWVRNRPLALMEQGWLLVHAGVLPQWTEEQTLALAAEVERRLRAPDYADFVRVMYGNQPDEWDEALAGDDRLRLVVNTLTRARFLETGARHYGRIDFQNKRADVSDTSRGLLPWFAVPRRETSGTPMAFGHWSTLGLNWEQNALCLDTGCLWGGALTAVVLPPSGQRWLQMTQIPCARSLDPMMD